MGKTISILFTIILSSQVFFVNGQIVYPKQIDAASYKLDSLKELYGKNKTFIPEFELQSLIALSGYPELKNDFIVFKYHPISTTGKTIPTFNTLIKKQHHYIIYINANTKEKNVSLKDAPFNAQVGLMSHELGHIADFKNKNITHFFTWALNVFSSKKNHASMEKKTDFTAIQHGFGWQLYDWINYVLNNSHASKKYIAFKKYFYLQPNEIAAILQKDYVNQ